MHVRLCTHIAIWVVIIISATERAVPLQAADRPNILLAISDDQSWLHASA